MLFTIEIKKIIFKKFKKSECDSGELKRFQIFYVEIVKSVMKPLLYEILQYMNERKTENIKYFVASG